MRKIPDFLHQSSGLPNNKKKKKARKKKKKKEKSSRCNSISPRLFWGVVFKQIGREGGGGYDGSKGEPRMRNRWKDGDKHSLLLFRESRSFFPIPTRISAESPGEGPHIRKRPPISLFGKGNFLFGGLRGWCLYGTIKEVLNQKVLQDITSKLSPNYCCTVCQRSMLYIGDQFSTLRWPHCPCEKKLYQVVTKESFPAPL